LYRDKIQQESERIDKLSVNEIKQELFDLLLKQRIEELAKDKITITQKLKD